MALACATSDSSSTLTELIRREMLRPERLPVGQLHLVLQLQAFALPEDTDGGGQTGGERETDRTLVKLKIDAGFAKPYKIYIKS